MATSADAGTVEASLELGKTPNMALPTPVMPPTISTVTAVRPS
jgi:hypothetical protein